MTTRTITELVDLLKTCRAVESIGEFTPDSGRGQRWYLNLWDVARTFRGDQTAKWWVDSRGILNHEPGKGTRSMPFQESVAILNEFLAEHQIDVRKVIQ